MIIFLINIVIQRKFYSFYLIMYVFEYIYIFCLLLG